MDFQIGREIGRGGFCMVHEVVLVDEGGNQAGTIMAIKRLRDDLHEPPEAMTEIRQRFEREARLLDDLAHENVVPVLARNLSGVDPFFIMPLADCSLWSQVRDHVDDERWVCSVFRQVLEGMAYAHSRGVIHRDVKPDNALAYGSLICLTDFGLGKNLADGTAGLTRTASWAGTEAYMAPEQFTEMKDAGPAADVFSLGKLLIALLTGEHPEVGVPDVSELPERFRYFASRCCEKKPENRFADAKSALEAFDRVDGEPVFGRLDRELEALIEAWFAASGGPDLEVIKEIDRLLREHPGEEALFTKQVPRFPSDLISRYLSELPDAFVQMLRIYDGHVSGGLPFDYCDDVADLYVDVFQGTDRLDIRRLVLRRLLEVGYVHNRYYVRNRLLATLCTLDEATDASTIAMAADEICASSAAGFTGEMAPRFVLPKAIQAAFTEATAN